MPHSEGLLTRIRQSDSKLHPEDAFVVPAWFAQQRSWLREQGKADSAIYNYPVPLHIVGPLNTESLERSVREILKRHQVLRSVFRIIDGELVQIVTEEPEMLAIPCSI